MPLEHLEELFLRPQATEVSYKFLEELVLDRIGTKVLGPLPGKDSLVDLLHVFTKMVTRAGSGWIVVKSRRISRHIIVPILSTITELDKVSDEVIGSLHKLLSVSPVLLMCDSGMILVEVTRILKSAQVPSVNMWRLARSVLLVGKVGAVETQLVISVALANLAISRTGYEAASCMEVLLILMTSIATDPQMLNTTVGLSQRSASLFSDDEEVRRLAAEIVRKSSNVPRTNCHELPVSTPEVAVPVFEATPYLDQIKEDISDKQPVNSNAGEVMHDDSPRSSCPSLDL